MMLESGGNTLGGSRVSQDKGRGGAPQPLGGNVKAENTNESSGRSEKSKSKNRPKLTLHINPTSFEIAANHMDPQDAAPSTPNATKDTNLGAAQSNLTSQGLNSEGEEDSYFLVNHEVENVDTNRERGMKRLRARSSNLSDLGRLDVSSRYRGGPQLSEAHGFVGLISVWLFFVAYIFWAMLPETTLPAMGVPMVPAKYWILALPAFGLGAYVAVTCATAGFMLIHTPSLEDASTYRDSHSVDLRESAAKRSANLGTPLMMDMSIGMVSRLKCGMYASPRGAGKVRAPTFKRQKWDAAVPSSSVMRGNVPVPKRTNSAPIENNRNRRYQKRLNVAYDESQFRVSGLPRSSSQGKPGTHAIDALPQLQDFETTKIRVSDQMQFDDEAQDSTKSRKHRRSKQRQRRHAADKMRRKKDSNRSAAHRSTSSLKRLAMDIANATE